jgi:hypothetical protein
VVSSSRAKTWTSGFLDVSAKPIPPKRRKAVSSVVPPVVRVAGPSQLGVLGVGSLAGEHPVGPPGADEVVLPGYVIDGVAEAGGGGAGVGAQGRLDRDHRVLQVVESAAATTDTPSVLVANWSMASGNWLT